MTERKSEEPQSPKDRLVTRPDEPLPTPLDPAGPQTRGRPDDPKPEPESGQGTDPHAGDLDYCI
jgi:hypothetical protein